MLNAKQIKELEDKLYEAHDRRKKQLMSKYFNEYKWENISEDNIQKLVDQFKERIHQKMTDDAYRDGYFVMPSSKYPASYTDLDRRINIWIEVDYFPELREKHDKNIPELDEEIEQEGRVFTDMQDLLYSHPNEDEVTSIFEYIASNIVEPVCV